MLKATLALHDKVLPPSINFERPNPNLDWSASPFAVNTELRDWDIAADRTRVAGVSAFGFGGTNFHVVMEEYVPGRGRRATASGRSVAVPGEATSTRRRRAGAVVGVRIGRSSKPPLRGALVLGADSAEALANELRTALAEARQGRHLEPAAPSAETLRAPERIAIDYADGAELVAKAEMALRVHAVRQRGGRGRRCGVVASTAAAARPGKVAFLYTGQGSQYANMLADLREREPAVARPVRRGGRDHVAAARGAAALGHHLRRPR